MPLRRSLLLVGLCALSACAFDAATDARRVIRCDGTDACPTGFVCQQRLGRCLQPSGDDRQAPSLVSGAVDPTIIGRHGSARVSVVVSEALAVEPELTLALGDFTARTPMSAEADAPLRFVAQLSAEGAPTGVLRVAVTLVDPAGNELVDLPFASLTIDGTPPVVESTEVLAASTDAGAYTVRPGQSVSLRLRFSERLARAPTLSARSATCGSVAVPPAVFSGELAQAAISAPPMNGCTFQLFLDEAVDVAGNVTANQPLPGTLLVDDQAPLLANVAIGVEALDGGLVPSSSFGRVSPANQLALHFDLADPEAALAVRFDDGPFPGCTREGCVGARCRCSRSVLAADAEGPHAVTIVATDRAGNAVSHVVPVQFDFTPPRLLGAPPTPFLEPGPTCPIARPLSLGAGARAVLTVSTDDAVSVQASSGDAGVSWRTLAGAAGTFLLEGVPNGAQLGTGAHAITVELADPVGNVVRVDLPTLLQIDGTPPAAPVVLGDGGLLYRRFPWGEGAGQPRFELLCPGSAVTHGAVLRALSEPAVAGLELGRSTTFDGGTQRLPLLRADYPRVFAVATDEACNDSPIIEVRRHEWHATLGGKRVGSTFENPHRVSSRGLFTTEASPPDAQELEPSPLTDADGAVVSVTSPRSWRGVSRSGASSLAMTYDARRRRVVVFGGRTPGGPEAETWEWDGAHWTSGGFGPAPREQTALVFDEARGVSVLYGGFGGTGLLERFGDTWLWDGSAWLRVPGDGPGVRTGHAMAYDRRRGRVLLSGGTGQDGLRDTFAFDGARWLSVDGDGPPRRRGGAMAYDVARDAVVLYGGTGFEPFADLADTWEFQDGGWRERLVSGPPPLHGHTLTYDARARRCVLVGGTTNAGVARADTWEWDGVSWRSVAGPAAGLSEHGAAWDDARGVLVAYGSAGEVWERSDAGWARRTPPGPGQRSAPTLTYDERLQKSVLVGGERPPNSPPSSDVWLWDGRDWTPGPPTPAVHSHQAAYDPRVGAVTLAGGYLSQAVRRLLDGGTWEVLPSLPTRRDEGALVFDSARQTLVLLGGGDRRVLGPHLELTDAGWVALDGGPSWRYGPAASVDERTGELHLFGGAAASRDDVSRSEFWRRTDAGWIVVGPAGPPAREAAHLVFDSRRNQTLLFGGWGQIDDRYFADLWAWDGGRWTKLSDGPLTPRLRAGVTYDRRRDKVVVAAGRRGSSLGDVWEYGLDELGRPALHVAFSLAGVGADGGAFESLAVRAVAGAVGADGDAGVTGVELWLAQGGRLVLATANDAGAAAPAALGFAPPAAGVNDTLEFALTPRGLNTALQSAQLAVDSVEAVVTFLRP